MRSDLLRAGSESGTGNPTEDANGDGSSPCSDDGVFIVADGSGTGMADSNAAVYGCAGRVKSASGDATSHSLPRYITATRSLTFLTTARSWAMNTSVRP